MGEWLGVRAAAKYIHKSPDVLWGAIKRGELSAYYLPSEKPRAYVHSDDIDEWVRRYWMPVNDYAALLQQSGERAEVGAPRRKDNTNAAY
jgi:hypothetical protein